MGNKPFLVVANKLDLPEAREKWDSFKTILEREKIEGWGISALSGEGVSELLERIKGNIKRGKRERRNNSKARRNKNKRSFSSDLSFFFYLFREVAPGSRLPSWRGRGVLKSGIRKIRI